MKNYEKPNAFVISIATSGIIATSDLKYSGESADKNYEVLGGKHRGEWGNIWKKQ